MDSETVRDKINIIKKVLDNCCFFCENELEGESKESLSLPLCKICHGKYKLNKELNQRLEENGSGAKWRENIRIVKELFTNRCFFCKNGSILPRSSEQSEIEGIDFLFPLCNASCYQKYRLIETWRRLGILSIQ